MFTWEASHRTSMSLHGKSESPFLLLKQIYQNSSRLKRKRVSNELKDPRLWTRGSLLGNLRTSAEGIGSFNWNIKIQDKGRVRISKEINVQKSPESGPLGLCPHLNYLAVAKPLNRTRKICCFPF